MFDQLEKILIEELFEEKIFELNEKCEREPFEAQINDLTAVKSAYEKIKKLF